MQVQNNKKYKIYKWINGEMLYIMHLNKCQKQNFNNKCKRNSKIMWNRVEVAYT